MSAGPPPDLNSPTQSKKTCSQACRVELAQDAANNLQTLMNRTAWGLAILGGLLTLAGGLLQLVAAADDASIFGIPLGLALHALGFALIGFGPMVALIGAEAGFFSSEFSRQAGWGSDKWTTTNIEAFRQQELGYVTFATNVSLLITIALHQAEGFLNNNGKFLSIGAQIGGLVGLLSQNWFKSNINNTVNQEEAVLNPNTIIDCSTVAACS